MPAMREAMPRAWQATTQERFIMLKTPAIPSLMVVGAIIALAACSPRETPAPAIPDPLINADNDMKAVLASLQSLNPKPIETLTPQEARLQPSPANAVKKLLKDQGKDPAPNLGVRTKDILVRGDIGMIPARVYTPESKSPRKKLPVIVYYHGGGWVIADLDTYDSTPRAMAKAVNAIVVSVHYRQAPENKFPAAHHDAFAAYKWVVTNAASLGGDSRRIAVMGESAGANLAINTAIAARDKNVPMPMYQVLVYPVAGVNMQTPSYIENANAKPLNKPMMEWFVRQTINTPADLQDARIDLVGRADLRDLPPATVVTAEIDPLRSEGQLLAQKLKEAGVDAELKDYSGVTHEFFGMALAVDDAKAAQASVASDLKAAFRTLNPSVK